MATWTDSQIQSTASVASTVEVQLGSTINIPAGQSWNIRSLYWAHSGDGIGRISIDTLAGMTATYQVNSNDPTSMGTNAGSSQAHDVNFTVPGPATLKAYINPTSSASTVGLFAMKYQVTG